MISRTVSPIQRSPAPTVEYPGCALRGACGLTKATAGSVPSRSAVGNSEASRIRSRPSGVSMIRFTYWKGLWCGMSPAATASLPALQPPAYQRHDTPLALSRSPMVGCVSGCFMTVLTRCGGDGGGGGGGGGTRRGPPPPPPGWPARPRPPPPPGAAVARERRIRLAVAAERRRQGRVGRAALVRLSALVVGEPVRARVRPEEMIEGTILEEEDDDVIDRGTVATRLAAHARACGEQRSQRRRAEAPGHRHAEAAAALSFFFLPLAAVPPSAFGAFSFFSAPSLRALPPSTRSTSSRMTIGALSPGRRPVLMMRV